MKTNIKYSIINILFWTIGFSISLIGFIVLLTDSTAIQDMVWVVIGYGVFSLVSVVMLLISIKNIQWFDIVDGYIIIRSPFGVIKRAHLTEIKKVFKIEASIFEIKRVDINRPHIVLCLKKTLKKGSIVDAYNRKEHPYIIIPYTQEIENFICSEYTKTCDDELMIK